MKLFEYIRRYKWDLGIALESEGHRYDSKRWNFHIVKAPKNCWYADPFILDVTDTDIIVLVEEFSYNINKGRLAKLTIDKKSYKIKDSKIILDRTTHLSFPAILRTENHIYIYPENSASGLSTIYRYNPETDDFKAIEQLINLPLTDAIITDYFDKPTLFATKIPEQNSNVVSIYQSFKIVGQYLQCQQISFSDNTARSAGDLFWDGDMIIRPAQDCNGSYGKGLVFQQVKQDAGGTFYIEELFRREPLKGYEGMHTYNQYKGYYIVDLHTRRFPKLHKLFQTIKHI